MNDLGVLLVLWSGTMLVLVGIGAAFDAIERRSRRKEHDE